MRASDILSNKQWEYRKKIKQMRADNITSDIDELVSTKLNVLKVKIAKIISIDWINLITYSKSPDSNKFVIPRINDDKIIDRLKTLTNLYSNIVWKHNRYAEALIDNSTGKNTYASHYVDVYKEELIRYLDEVN